MLRRQQIIETINIDCDPETNKDYVPKVTIEINVAAPPNAPIDAIVSGMEEISHKVLARVMREF